MEKHQKSKHQKNPSVPFYAKTILFKHLTQEDLVHSIIHLFQFEHFTLTITNFNIKVVQEVVAIIIQEQVITEVAKDVLIELKEVVPDNYVLRLLMHL